MSISMIKENPTLGENVLNERERIIYITESQKMEKRFNQLHF